VQTFNWGEVQSKVVALVESFSTICGTPSTRKEIRWLLTLVVGSQIANLTFDPSFGHNLCFKYANGSYEPILDIYVPRAFQWYKELLNLMSFDPCNRTLKIWESIGTTTPKVGAHLGVWGFIPSHSLTFPRAWDVTLGLPSWPAPLQALALVTNPRLGLWHYVFLVSLVIGAIIATNFLIKHL